MKCETSSYQTRSCCKVALYPHYGVLSERTDRCEPPTCLQTLQESILIALVGRDILAQGPPLLQTEGRNGEGLGTRLDFIPLSLEPISSVFLSPSYWCYSLLTRTKLSHFVYPPFSPHSVATPGFIIDLMEKGITKCLVWTPDPSGHVRKGLWND